MWDKTSEIFNEVVHDPATTIALGSAFMSAAAGSPEGAALNILATLGIGGLKAYEAWKEEEKGKPFAALGCVNLGTAGSIAYNALQSPDTFLECLPKFALASAYTVWGVRSALLAWQERQSTTPDSFKNDPQFYQGLGALLTTKADILPALLSCAGILRTMKNEAFEKASASVPETWKGFLTKHWTAPRAYSAQYAASSAEALGKTLDSATASNIEATVGFLIWSWAFSRFDKKLNRELVPDVKEQLGVNMA